MSKPKAIERVKNFSLVVLFLSTVLLLYFFWGNISFDGLKTPAEQTAGDPPDTVKMLVPSQIIVNFGAENYTVLPPGELWQNLTDRDSFVEELARFGPVENVLVEEITYEQYRQVREFRSIWAEFDYDIPFADFCSSFHMKKPQSYDVIESVTKIGYSTAEKGDSLYVVDGKAQKTFRIVAAATKDSINKTGNTEFPAFIDSIEANGYPAYYPISSYLGVSNNTLVPLSVEANLQSFSFLQDTYSYQTEKINTMAERFFGGNFDFVRRIVEESGTVIYMYGYGQNVLIVNTDGSMEYKEEQVSGITDQSFSGALETAVKFVADHGSWKSLEGAEMTPYLKDVIPDPNGRKGYRFLFGMEINGTRLHYEKGAPIVIDVTSGQVTYYKRHLIDFDEDDIKVIETASGEEAFSAVNLIAQNYKYIYDILLQAGEVKATADQAAMFEKVASLVNKMEIGYVKLADPKVTEIQPAWILTVYDTDVYFNLYSADPIGYSRE